MGKKGEPTLVSLLAILKLCCGGCTIPDAMRKSKGEGRRGKGNWDWNKSFKLEWDRKDGNAY